MNTLYYGDNLKILRYCINDESVDLVYINKPFNVEGNVVCRVDCKESIVANDLRFKSLSEK